MTQLTDRFGIARISVFRRVAHTAKGDKANVANVANTVHTQCITMHINLMQLQAVIEN